MREGTEDVEASSGIASDNTGPVTSFKTAAETGKFEEEVTFVRKDGSRFVGILTVRPLLKRGEIAGYMGLTRHLRSI